MIERLAIKNFKSIKDLEIECKKINLFIGEPNTGKSNLLEALGLLSWSGSLNENLKEYVRFQGTQNLFYDDVLDQPVEIKIENSIRAGIEIKFVSDIFSFEKEVFQDDERVQSKWFCNLDYFGSLMSSEFPFSEFGFIKFYRFVRQDKFPERSSSFLLPPHGSNMFSVVYGNKKLRETMARFFKNFGFNLVLKPQERTFEIQKQIEDVIVTYPYILTSDTLQRIIFHVIAIESNKNSTLIFEEPESHAFPYYTKYLGEKIAFDETNQYFIVTHNPYLLRSILEKAKKESVNVFITYFKDYETKVKCLSIEEVSELMDHDPFFNLDLFIEEENK